MTKRPTNAELCAAFRALLTGGATDVFDKISPKLYMLGGEPVSNEMLLEATKPWRGDLWKAFREIEKRMCPQPGDD